MSILTKLTDLCTYLGNKIKNLESRQNRINYQLETEIDTGNTWIDGKKIYIQVFSSITINDKIWHTIGRILNIDTVISQKMSILNTHNSMWFTDYCDMSTYVMISVVSKDSTNNNGNVMYKSNYSNDDTIYIFIEYTKK